MKNMLFMMVLFCVSSLAGQARNVNANSFDDSLRSEADKLLTEWMDAFLAYQYTCSDSALDGGVLCPACARMHGRIGDAVLPLMYLAEKPPAYIVYCVIAAIYVIYLHRQNVKRLLDGSENKVR